MRLKELSTGVKRLYSDISLLGAASREPCVLMRTLKHLRTALSELVPAALHLNVGSYERVQTNYYQILSGEYLVGYSLRWSKQLIEAERHSDTDEYPLKAARDCYEGRSKN
jgi:hypothetical protein